MGGLARADDVGTAGSKSAGKDKGKRKAKGGRRRAGRRECRQSRPGPIELVSRVGAARPTWRKQSGCQQLAASATAGEVDRVCGEPVDEESGGMPSGRSTRPFGRSIGSLMWTTAQGRCTAAMSSRFGELRSSTLRRSSARRKRFSDGDDSPSLREMLKGRGGCSPSASQANLATYEYSRVSVPESVRDSPFLETLDVEGSGLVKGHETRMQRHFCGSLARSLATLIQF